MRFRFNDSGYIAGTSELGKIELGLRLIAVTRARARPGSGRFRIRLRFEMLPDLFDFIRLH